ncbi:MAG: hypothetical protein E7261_12510 [Lachnospiraceae bacterium]|nr:hypothetical protein [Lachnospiraceae bacterium]
MKKILSVFVVLFFAFVLTACKEEQDSFEVTLEEKRYLKNYQIYSVSDDGTFYIGKDNMIHYIIPNTGEDMIFCYDPNCLHIPASVDKPDPTCMAATYVEKNRMAYYEGNIYLFVYDGLFAHKVYKMDADGSGRVEIASFPFSLDLSYYTFYNDKMYYTAVIKEVDEINGDINSTNQLIEFDLLKGTYRVILDMDKELLNNVVEVTDTAVYLHIDGSEGDYLKRVNLNTLEETVIIDSSKHKEHRCVSVYNDEHYIYLHNVYAKYEIGISSMVSDEDTPLITFKDDEFLGIVKSSGNGIFYTVFKGDIKDLDMTQVKYYFYNLATDELVDITEKGREYRLVSYDEQNDIFIGRWDEHPVAVECSEVFE